MNRLYAELNARRRPTPKVTIDGIMYSVRERGLAALHEADVVERLSRCDEKARAQINERIARLFPEAGQ
jgi:hypothetical protein